jgi:hypothetical protein
MQIYAQSSAGIFSGLFMNGIPHDITSFRPHTVQACGRPGIPPVVSPRPHARRPQYLGSTRGAIGERTWRSRLLFITAVPITKLFAWGEGDSGGHVLRETTSRGLCGLVCLSRTSERGGKGDCVKEGGGEEEERERERALGLRLRHSRRY